jgi:hypothetical protein
VDNGGFSYSTIPVFLDSPPADCRRRRDSMQTLTWLKVGIGTLVSLSLNVVPVQSLSAPTTPLVNAPQSTKEATFPEELIRAGYCETRLHHFDEKGNTIIGRTSPDIGIFQISAPHHEDTAKSLGLNLYDLQDNLTYALRLYRHRGVKDWSWSYNPQKDQCKNQVRLPARDSKEWKEIKTLFLRSVSSES